MYVMHYLILLFFLTLTGMLGAQTHHETALRAYLSNDPAVWAEAVAATKTIADPAERMLTEADYQLAKAYAHMATKDNDAIAAVVDRVDELLDEYWDLNDKNAAAHGLYSALLGLKIAQAPMKGMLYGSRATKYAAKGVELDPNDPAALYNAAGNLFYTPEQWGGDPEKAVTYLKKAVQQYGSDAAQDWHYLSTLALLGQAQAKVGKTDEARATYQRALAAQPTFGYVKYMLLPELDKKSN